MSKRMPGMLPQHMQLVGCWFPDKESPTSPGPKFRPACVMAINSHVLEDHPKIGLIYGTGQATTAKLGPELKNYEFEVEKNEAGNSLAEQTRFDCSRFVWLPFTEEWFKPKNDLGRLIVYGKVPESRRTELRAAMKEGELKFKPLPSKPVIVVKTAKIPTAKTLSLPVKATKAAEPNLPDD